MSVQPEDSASNPNGQSGATPRPKRSMSRTQKILFFATGWLIVLMPFLFWWNTWFGRHLSDQQMTEYLHDEKKPRHIQHALVQLGDRMSHADSGAKQWYPDLVRLAAHPVDEVRNTDAWVMGQDTSGAGFHETLLKMLFAPVTDATERLDAYAVRSAPAIKLLAQSRPEAADWWRANAPHLLKPWGMFAFDIASCEPAGSPETR